MVEDHSPRAMWRVTEPVHAVVYFAPQVVDAYKELGLRGFWMGYFAGRSAALGPASAELVSATFFNFHHSMPARALPDAWAIASPSEVLEARLRGVDAALAGMLDGRTGAAQLGEAAVLARAAVDGCSLDGRPLFAAHAALPWPEPAHLRLWHAATLLREHRGDGHVAANLAAGIGGLDAHVMAVGSGSVPRELILRSRGWSEQDWVAATERLVRTGVLDRDGTLTDEGRNLRRSVEETTDRLAAEPWTNLGERGTSRLHELLGPIAATVAESGLIPFPNPMGLPPPG